MKQEKGLHWTALRAPFSPYRFPLSKNPKKLHGQLNKVPSSMSQVYLPVYLQMGILTSPGSCRCTAEAVRLWVSDLSSGSMSCFTESEFHPPRGHRCDPYTYRYISPAVNHPCSNIQRHTRPIHDPFWRHCWPVLNSQSLHCKTWTTLSRDFHSIL